MVRLANSQFESAIVDFNRALSLGGHLEFASAYANRGLAFLSLGKHEEADSDFTRALHSFLVYV